ncbi:thiamine biosynthesis protein ThiC [Erythrobacter rubeus]|uniref:Thiamine biosynthesis protein ThiC n=1 Tax=Erythrobacter rubeus TaxID=2760803 RepID=A0ABR8KP06_9SPHN|nr:thiamine biosynthesis protein ThiC [Erythrobacter rubeus]MBD2840883.1 thiamine biosynthesis protein ThiC [Erythrobacter rubeus]
MVFTAHRAAQIVAFLLVSVVATQALYTALYLSAPDIVRTPIWGVEALLFLGIAAFSASPLVQSRLHTVGWGAIFASAILNVVQVGVGITMFGPFGEMAGNIDAAGPAAGAVVAFSFFVYNAAKVLLGFAALTFGLGQMRTGTGAAKVIGVLAVLAGIAAVVTNFIVMAFGRMDVVPSGAAGVAATLLLAFTLTHAVREDSAEA